MRPVLGQKWLAAFLSGSIFLFPQLTLAQDLSPVSQPRTAPQLKPAAPDLRETQSRDWGTLPLLLPQTQKLSRLQLKQSVRRYLEQQDNYDAAALAHFVEDLYLQSGYPSVQVEAELSPQGLSLAIDETPAQEVRVCFVTVSGGTPQMRFATRWNLHNRAGEIFNREQLFADIEWIEQNHFVPLDLKLEQISPESVAIVLQIPEISAWIPTANVGLNNVVGLALTAGVIANNAFDQGHIFRASVKRNNIPFSLPLIGTFQNLNEVQDWEYTLSMATSNLQDLVLLLPWELGQHLWNSPALHQEGISIGLNHYNKVDFIYPTFNPDNPLFQDRFDSADDLLWIRSFGADIYSGFPLWRDSRQRRYLRGVANLSLLEDRFIPGSTGSLDPTQISSSGNRADLMLLPSFSLMYSDMDDFRLPRNGNFIRGRLEGNLLDGKYLQGTLRGFSVWSPWLHDKHQWSLVTRSSLGSTFGFDPPFHRNFLNTNGFLIRGATQYSIQEKHGLRLSEELHYIYRPTDLELSQFFESLLNLPNVPVPSNLSFDFNIFADSAVFWRDQLSPQSAQLSFGTGFNIILPAGTIIGLDFAIPVYPFSGGLLTNIRLSAPLSFTLFSDWANTNGFFYR